MISIAHVVDGELIPEWAIGRIDGRLVHGAQLPTRDGRRMGNAHIIDIEQKQYEALAEPVVLYTILTDAGTRIKMVKTEVEECFWPPEWVSDVDKVLAKFDRS